MKKRIYMILYMISIGIIWFLYYKLYEGNAFKFNDLAAHNQFAQILFETEMSENRFLPHVLMYPMYHVFTKLTAYLVNMNYAAASAIVLATVNISSIWLFSRLMRMIIKSEDFRDRVFCDVISIGGVIFVTARCWLNDWRFYKHQCAANPIHNPTTLMVRPLGIIAVICFGLLIYKYERGEKYGKQFISFMAVILLSIVAKPSFVIVFLPAMAIIALKSIIRRRDVKLGVIVGGVGVLLLLLLLVFLKNVISVSALLNSTKIQFGSFSEFSALEVIKVSLVTFPVPILLANRRAFRENVLYRLSILALLAGWGEMFFLTNGISGDFSWGYDLSVQIATVTALACTRVWQTGKMRKYLAYAVYGYQVFCGIQYLILCNQTGKFWF